jgi:uncharacterized OB-fold protein
MTALRPRSVGDLDSAEWWQAIDRHELLLQRCSECRRLRWPPRPSCGECGSHGWEWINSAGAGTIASWTVTHHSFIPDVVVPFVVVLVRLDDQDDVFIPGHVDGPGDGSGLRIGQPVEVGFEELAGDGGPMTLLRWRTRTT